MTIDAFHGFTLAIVLLFVGKGLVVRDQRAQMNHIFLLANLCQFRQARKVN